MANTSTPTVSVAEPQDQTGAVPGTTPGTSSTTPAPNAVPGTSATPPAYTPQNDSAASQLTGLLASNSPYIQQAKSAGMDAANARGVQNSSIAAQASEGAAIAAAAPIATADAQTAAAKNLSNQQYLQTKSISDAQNVTTLANTGIQTASAQAIAQMNISSQQQMQVAQIIANANLQAQQLGSEQQIAQLQAQTQTAIANLNIGAAATQQANQIAAQELMQSQSLASTEQIAQQQSATQLNIAQMNVTSDQQDKAAAAATTYGSIYASEVNAINANTSMPADARATALQNAYTTYSNNMTLVEQTYNVSLSWGASDGSGNVSAT